MARVPLDRVDFNSLVDQKSGSQPFLDQGPLEHRESVGTAAHPSHTLSGQMGGYYQSMFILVMNYSVVLPAWISGTNIVYIKFVFIAITMTFLIFKVSRFINEKNMTSFTFYFEILMLPIIWGLLATS